VKKVIQMTTIAECAEYLTKALTLDPEAVSLKEIEGEKLSFIQLRVAPEDKERLFEERGQAVDALHTLLNAAAARQRKEAVLEINGTLFRPDRGPGDCA
jgi:predicted RNA-binding protein YlqC (UPF0109 family)